MANGNATGISSGSDSPQSDSYSGKGKMTGGKEKTSKSASFAQGGSQHMLTGSTAGPQVPGQSASMGKGGGKFISGGTTKDVGPQHANPQEPGVAGHTTSSGQEKFAAGGKGADNHMFGKQTAKTATPA